MGRPDILQAAKNGLHAPGIETLPIAHQRLDLLALQGQLRAAKVARNDGKALALCVRDEILFLNVCQRANDDMRTIVGQQLRRHGFQLAAKE